MHKKIFRLKITFLLPEMHDTTFHTYKANKNSKTNSGFNGEEIRKSVDPVTHVQVLQ